MSSIHPATTPYSLSTKKRLLALAVLLVSALPAESAPTNAKAKMNAATEAQPAAAATALQTLEVIGVGLSVENLRQIKVWETLQQKPGQIVAPDPKRSQMDWSRAGDLYEKRAADALEYCASWFVEGWPIPSVTIQPTLHRTRRPNELSKNGEDGFSNRILDLLRPAGMHHHAVVRVATIFGDAPEETLEGAFRFFEMYPQAPALLLFGWDGYLAQAQVSAPYKPDANGQRPNLYSESMACLLLARRERVDALRPHARSPSSYPAFKPSTYLPQPWSAEQLKRFDALPTLAILHRPERVSYRRDGKLALDAAFEREPSALLNPAQQQAAFGAAWQRALAAVTPAKPARIFFDYGTADRGRALVPLLGTLTQHEPDLDLFEPSQGINLSQRLGDTGAASPFVQWALAIMASYRNNDVSATVNLRDPQRAMLTVVSPPPKRPAHPASPDPFGFGTAPDR